MQIIDKMIFMPKCFELHDIYKQTKQKDPSKQECDKHLNFWNRAHKTSKIVAISFVVGTIAAASLAFAPGFTIVASISAIALSVICGISFYAQVRAQKQKNEWSIKQADAALTPCENWVPSNETLKVNNRQPNILLFNCQYGSGHKMATQGIKESLPDCKFHVVDAYNEPLRALDIMKYIDSELSFEKFFNTLAKKEKYGLLNLLGKLGEISFPKQRKRFEKLLLKYIEKEMLKEKPDIIISCIPIINPALASIGKKLNIPVLVVTTDLDIENFTSGLKEEDCAGGKKNFRITSAYDRENWEIHLGNKIPNYIKEIIDFSTGYPTRRAFNLPTSPEKIEEIRRTYLIQNDENVACVMMGGNTAQAAKSYAKHLLAMNEQQIEEICGQQNPRKKIRLICLCGDIKDAKNRLLMEKLNGLNFMEKANQSVTIHAVPGTPKIAELISPPEFFAMISKAGGSTIGEMTKKKVPMIYHIKGTPISWEKGNMIYGEAQELGQAFKMPKQVTEKSKHELSSLLKEARNRRQEIIDGTRLVPEAEYDFSQNIRSIVSEMLNV